MSNFFNVNEKIYAPATGLITNLCDIDDEVFSQGLMGPGLAIKLGNSDPEIFAPISGTVEALYPTGHAVGIKTGKGIDILLHVGLESFKKRDLVKKYIRQGEEIRKGQLLLEMNYSVAEPKDRILLLTLPNFSLSLKTIQSNGAVEACKSMLYEIVNK